MRKEVDLAYYGTVRVEQDCDRYPTLVLDEKLRRIIQEGIYVGIPLFPSECRALIKALKKALKSYEAAQ